MRSGVNWTRLKSRSRAAARVLTSRVLATPGTPSRRTWPRTRRATTRAVTTRSWPTTALATSSRTRRTASRGSLPLSLVGTDHLPAQHFGTLRQLHQLPVGCRRTLAEETAHVVGVAPGALGGGGRDRDGELDMGRDEVGERPAPMTGRRQGHDEGAAAGARRQQADGQETVVGVAEGAVGECLSPADDDEVAPTAPLGHEPGVVARREAA